MRLQAIFAIVFIISNCDCKGIEDELPSNTPVEKYLREMDHFKTALAISNYTSKSEEILASIKDIKSDTVTEHFKIELFCIICDQCPSTTTIEDKIECLRWTVFAASLNYPVEPFARTWIEFRRILYKEKSPKDLTNAVCWFLQHKPHGIDRDDRKCICRYHSAKHLDTEHPFEMVKNLAAAEETGEGVEPALEILDVLDDAEKLAKRGKTKTPGL